MKPQHIHACIILCFLLSSHGFSGEAAPSAPPTPVVSVGTVGVAKNVEVRRYTGHVTATAEVHLVARVSGELLKVGFNEGDVVKEGQVLYELDPVRYEAAVKSAEAKIKEAEARLSYAEISHGRSEELYRKKAVTKDQRDSAESEYNAGQAALMNAEAQLITARDDLKNTRITAPISGKIGTTKYTRGNYLTPNSGVIATVVQIDPLRVNFTISNRDFLSMFGNERGLKENADIRLKLADGSMYPLSGTVEYIDNRANPRTDTLQIYASFANPDGVLVPGSSLQVMLSRGAGADLPSVMPSAVMHDAKTAFIYVLDEENRVERRDVRLGYSTADQQLIEDGVRPGEKIVVDGTHKIRHGSFVTAKTTG